jgi:hypothetical protein
MQAAHVEQQLLQATVLRRVHVDVPLSARRALRPDGGGVGDGRQRGGLVPGHLDDGVDEEENESELGEDLVVLRRHQGLLGEFRRRGRRDSGSDDGWNLVLLVAPVVQVKHFITLLLTPRAMRRNHLPVTPARWQHGSQRCFATFI